MRGRTDLIFLGLVRGGHVSQILDHLLGVLCLTSSRLSSVRRDTESKKDSEEEKIYFNVSVMFMCSLELTCKEWTGLHDLQEKKCKRLLYNLLQNIDAVRSAYVITAVHTAGSALPTDRKSISGFL